jgi:hypothetical protein
MPELRDSNLAKAFVLQSLLQARLAARGSPAALAALRVAQELTAAGAPLLPLGFIADVVHLVTLSEDATPPPARDRHFDWLDRYEDLVLGKLYADSSFERAAAALGRYQGREHDQAIAFIIEQIRQRSGLDGISLSPAILRALVKLPADLLQTECAEANRIPLDEVALEYQRLIERIREVGDLLGPTDIFELEHRTAIAPPGERLALRQTLSARELLLAGVPQRPARQLARVREVPTRLLDENAYPVGGFSSLSTRGTIESLLHSQLAYMEPASAERPDMFDIKFLRDELLYYARDENQFFRRRRTFVFALYPELKATRVKDAGLPYQRIVLAKGLLLALIERLIVWLGDESLTFELLFVDDQTPALRDEAELLRLILREELAKGTVKLAFVPHAAVISLCREAGRHSLCQAVLLGTQPRALDLEVSTVQLLFSDALPKIVEGQNTCTPGETQIDGWRAALLRLLEMLR